MRQILETNMNQANKSDPCRPDLAAHKTQRICHTQSLWCSDRHYKAPP